MTDATLPPPHEPQDGVSLPVVGWCVDNFAMYVSDACKKLGQSPGCSVAMTPHAPAQATIDALRDELARMTERREALHNTLHSERDRTDKLVTKLHAEIAALKTDTERLTRERDQWRNEYRFMQSQEAEMARELESLKAKQIDVEAQHKLDMEAVEWCTAGAQQIIAERDAAREALRAALLGDGGTLPADPYLQTR